MTSTTRRLIHPAWARTFGSGVAAVLLSYFMLTTGTQSLVYDAVAVAASAAMFAGTIVLRPEPRSAWALLATGTLLLAAGDLVYGVSQPVPSPADVFYVSAYPVLALGLAGLRSRSGDVRRASTMVEGAFIAAAIAGMAMLFMLVPSSGSETAGPLASVIALGYPLMDLALAALLVRGATDDAARRVPFLVIGAGLVLRLVGDTGFLLRDVGTSYAVGDPLDVAWLLSYACFGIAALHPALAQETAAKPFGRVPHAAPVAARRGRTRVQGYRTEALRLRVVLKATGRFLLALGAVAIVLAGAWGSPNLVLLAGAYAVSGTAIVLASMVRT